MTGFISRRRVGWVFGPVLFLALLLLPEGAAGLSPAQRAMLAVAALMVVWWITEALPLAATAMLPIALYPLLGILPAKEATRAYAHPVLFLFMGGFLIALAMQKWRLHERLAMAFMLRVGTEPRRILLGFIVTTAFLSMWISNTATTMMMLPIVLSVLACFPGETKEFALSLSLAVAYSANVGGLATPIGTAPNAVMLGMVGEIFPEAPRISFVKWMTAGLPVSIIMALLVWGYFAWRIRHVAKEDVSLRAVFEERQRALGPMRAGERIVAIVGGGTVLLWLFRADIHLGETLTIHGWANLLPWPDMVDDGTVAMAMALLLFALPAGGGQRVLDWTWAARLPWHVILLLGGGFALARGFAASDLDMWVGERLHALGALPPWALLLGVIFALIFITEVTSNTAIATTSLPVLAALAKALSLNPIALMLPATFACECAFMLPTATPPNAIVFSSGRVSIPQMARTGFFLNLLATLVLTLLAFFFIYPMWGISLSEAPAWLSP